jgi:pilus assembly protein Flp/PilA
MLSDTSREAGRRFLLLVQGDRNSREMTEMSLTQLVQRLFRDEEGQDLIEYALLATFVALVAIAGAQALGSALNGWYNSVASRVNSAAANQ